MPRPSNVDIQNAADELVAEAERQLQTHEFAHLRNITGGNDSVKTHFSCGADTAKKIHALAVDKMQAEGYVQFKASMGKQLAFCKSNKQDAAAEEEKTCTYNKFVKGLDHDCEDTQRELCDRPAGERPAKRLKPPEASAPRQELAIKNRFATHEVPPHLKSLKRTRKKMKTEDDDDSSSSSSSSSSSEEETTFAASSSARPANAKQIRPNPAAVPMEAPAKGQSAPEAAAVESPAAAAEGQSAPEAAAVESPAAAAEEKMQPCTQGQSAPKVAAVHSPAAEGQSAPEEAAVESPAAEGQSAPEEAAAESPAAEVAAAPVTPVVIDDPYMEMQPWEEPQTPQEALDVGPLLRQREIPMVVPGNGRRDDVATIIPLLNLLDLTLKSMDIEQPKDQDSARSIVIEDNSEDN